MIKVVNIETREIEEIKNVKNIEKGFFETVIILKDDTRKVYRNFDYMILY